MYKRTDKLRVTRTRRLQRVGVKYKRNFVFMVASTLRYAEDLRETERSL